MTSPPKKRGGGILPSQSAKARSTNDTTRVPIIPKPNNIQTMPLPNSSITDKFADIQLQFKRQNEQNAIFNARISSLENTTNNIDSKMDRLLSFYETQAHPRSRIQQLNNTNNGMTMGSDRLTMTTNNAEHLPFNEY